MQKSAKRLSLIALIMMLLISLLFGSAISAEAKTTLTLGKTKTTIYVGYSEAITVKINGKKADAKKCTFKSSKTSVATVSSKGNIKAVKAGSATVTVTLKSNKKIKKTVKVTVKKNTISTAHKSFNYAKGDSNDLKIKVNGNFAAGGTLNYTTSNKSIATVSKDGKVRAIKKGTATITAVMKKDSKTKVSIKITVLDTKNFTISPSTIPLSGIYTNYGTYNSDTKHYYTIRTYLEKLEKLGGGTLTLSAGTYNVCTSVYIPSNVKIVLKDGVVINNTTKTGSSNFSPSGSLFMFIEPSKATVSGAHSAYNGVHDSSVVGNGNVTIDLKNSPSGKNASAFVLCHNKNITISGIHFTNLKQHGHFIELDASDNVIVSKCSFSNSQKKNDNPKADECINLDLPDKKTGGFTQVWTSYDKTPNQNITITDCTFTNVQQGVGSHQYTPDKYHTNIKILNNTFTNVVSFGISIYNWKGATISNNTLNGIGRDTEGGFYTNLGYNIVDQKKTHAIRGAGAYNIKMDNNVFMHCYDIYFYEGDLRSKYGYEISPNGMSEAEIDYIAENNLFIDDGLNDLSGSHPGQVRMRDSHDGVYESGYYYTRYIKDSETPDEPEPPENLDETENPDNL
ncbi:MAG: Ig-like domain-containing protein [Eubacterium sp.]|nr:Ig-like domain-containing protein [Eubacterium sp.]